MHSRSWTPQASSKQPSTAQGSTAPSQFGSRCTAPNEWLVSSFTRPSACYREHPDYDVGLTEAEVAEQRALFQTLWGTGITINFLMPSLADDERLVEEWARYERMMATPNAVLAVFDVLGDLDVRDLLPQVSTRTLVIHSTAASLFPVRRVAISQSTFRGRGRGSGR